MGTPGRTGLSRTAKILITLLAIAGTIGTLLYFEQVAIIYIGSTLFLIVLLLLVGFSDLESVGKKAAEEAYLTRRSEGVFPEMDVLPPQSKTAIRRNQRTSESKS